MKAVTTAGRAVLFAGTTVVIALLGLVAMGQKTDDRRRHRRVGDRAGDDDRRGDAVAGVAGLGRPPDRLIRAAPSPSPRAGGVPARARDSSPSAGRAWCSAGRWSPPRWPGRGCWCWRPPYWRCGSSLPDASVQPHDRSSYTSYRILSEGFGPGYGAPVHHRHRGRPGRSVEGGRRDPGHRFGDAAPDQRGRAGGRVHGLPRDRVPGRGDRATWCTSCATSAAHAGRDLPRRPERRRDRLRRGHRLPACP